MKKMTQFMSTLVLISIFNTAALNAQTSGPMTVTVNGSGSVSPDYNGAELDFGSDYYMAATAGPGSMFDNWTDGVGSLVTTNLTVGFTMADGLSLSANFSVLTHGPMTVNVSAGGSVSPNYNGADLDFGSSYSMTATADGGYNFDGWTDGSGNVVAAAATVGFTMSNGLVLSANFSVPAPTSGPLTVNISGQGTVSPDYNNAVLNFGDSYSMTATAAAGFAFANWTDVNGSILTSSATLGFTMSDGLTLAANFVDVASPTLSITYPMASQGFTSEVVIVAGNASDNVDVAAVFYNLNNSGWNLAGSLDAQGNWTAQVTLSPGANVIAAYAVDEAGNISDTNTVNGVALTRGPLSVSITGAGTISPDYNNVGLDFGSYYYVTATAAPGFVFANWTDGNGNILTYDPTLGFTMQPSLSLVANFTDVMPPTLSFTSPAPNQISSNVVLTVTGQTSDNVAVTDVFYNLNNTGWTGASTGNGWNDWTAQVNLSAGMNTISAYCVDAAGNTSETYTANVVRLGLDATPLYAFSGGDGANPYAGLILSGNTLYGTTYSGGSSSLGTVFAVNTDGSGFTTLYTFSGGNGANPYASLILLGNTLYGTTIGGGNYGDGTVFAVNTDGSGFTTLYTFTGGDGAYPYSSVFLSGNTLYGTTVNGGTNNQGTIFAVNTDGSGFTTLYTFTGGDGAYPYSSVFLSGNTLYGTTVSGGNNNQGTIFAVNPDGSSLTTLHNFTGGDGAGPYDSLMLSGDTLYGTTFSGGSSGQGTVFAVNTDGTSFTNLHTFTGSDGANPFASVILSGQTLYGTTYNGGLAGQGICFTVNTDGTGFKTLNRFTGGDGANPYAGLILSGDTLYGTTVQGGSSGAGTVFKLTLDLTAPTLSISSPVANQHGSDAVITVTGQTADNAIVANVFYNLNQAGWNVANTGDNWNHWTAPVTLAVGTNTVSAYAVDISGNLSATNTVGFVYRLRASLSMHTNGQGSITPNYNNAQLLIGDSYFMTATAKPGFSFVNWTDGNGIVTNGPTLSFVMASNLTFTANLMDISNPVVTVTSPTAGQHWSNAAFTVTGHASDNVAVANVFYNLNNTGWGSANTANKWTNWSRPVTLTQGTNNLSAYAVDATGNLSATSSVPFVYDVLTLLIVHTNGKGSIAPNYNQTQLIAGNSYSMTAAASPGFTFVNWTDNNGIVTSNATVTFSMSSNLVLTASFVDTAQPVLTVTTPTAGQQWSNAVLTVAGHASDNVQVTNVVYNLNHAGWNPANTTNNWTNWTAAVSLIAGTNTISAYAVDATGNLSATNTVEWAGILSTVLTVNTNGHGTVSPDYNQALLQIGASYSMTATASPGFGFVSWTDANGIVTNSATLDFVMASNLVFTANFADTERPALMVITPVTNQVCSNAVLNLAGQAGDNVAVANVFYNLNEAGWNVADTLDSWTNWTAQVSLTVGTNTLSAYAIDTAGNISATNTLNFVYRLPATLSVSTNGDGSIAPDYNNAQLLIGGSYTLTATANPGFSFVNWTGNNGIATNNPTLDFIMASNLALTANFVDIASPALSVTTPADGQHWSNALFTAMGQASDNVAVANVFYNLNNTGWSAANTLDNWTNWTAPVTLTQGANSISAYALDAAGNRSATNTVSFVYDALALLTVHTNGNGSIAPNFDQTQLIVGNSYSMTATASPGFSFVNWTDNSGIVTSNATISFTMSSNLVLTANFADIAPPVLTVTTPTAGESWSNALFTATGLASDNVAVANVFYNLNNAGWNAANTLDNWTNWTAQVTLLDGTNTLSTYAVDTTGNRSATNNVEWAGVLSAQLTVSTNGRGTISPGLNHAQLPFGASYAMTATASPGFRFVNWTDGIGTVTNGATLSFTMAPNLAFTANFIDIAGPTLTVTSPAPGQIWSNAVFTAAGQASDNVAVTNVFYNLNQTGWLSANTGNNWTNWTAPVTLTQKTNTLSVYAVDMSGNRSATNTASVICMSAPLTVNTRGRGTLTPNYNNVRLPVGSNYIMTAAAAAGFTFTNWTDGTGRLLTNKSALKFRMMPDLVLTANFVDIVRPTVSITNLLPGGSVSNRLFTLKGKAGDNLSVSNVCYNLNSSGWSAAATANNWTNWSAPLTLAAGTNTVSVYAVDTTGNLSVTNTVKFRYVVSGILTVRTNGKGSINPALNGALLQIGKSYTLTAAPGTGFVFTNWTEWDGSIVTNKPALSFVMASNLAFTANLIDVSKPVLTVTTPTAATSAASEFYVASGKAADNAGVSNVWYQLNHGGWYPAHTTNNWTDWNVTVDLAPGTNLFAAFAVDTSGNLSATSTMKFVYATAPATLSGLKAKVTPDGIPAFDVAFGASTFSQASEDTNNVNGVGSYTYTKLTPRSGRLDMNYTAPPLATNDGPQQLNLDFTAPGSAWFTNTAFAGTGSMTFTSTPPLVRPSILNQTVVYVDALGQGRSTFYGAAQLYGSALDSRRLLYAGGKYNSVNLITHGTNSGTNHAYTTYSPLGALLKQAGSNSTTYFVLTYHGTNSGTAYEESYDAAGHFIGTDAGVFGIASQRPGGNAPTNLVHRSAWVAAAGSSFKLLFATNTFAQPSPVDDAITNDAGSYVYVRVSTNTGSLDLNYTAPPETSSALFQFIAPNLAVFTNTDSTVGAAVFK